METNDRKNTVTEDTTDPANLSKETREKSDPQLTELSGFTDPKEDLEPTLEDGTKAPDKAKDEHRKNLKKD